MLLPSALLIYINKLIHEIVWGQGYMSMISFQWGKIATLSSAGPVMSPIVSFVEKESQRSIRDVIMVLENVVNTIE
jgi:hypothetical protein